MSKGLNVPCTLALSLILAACSPREKLHPDSTERRDVFEEKVYIPAPIDLGANPRKYDSYDIKTKESKEDMALDGRITVQGFDRKRETLTVTVYAGGLILQDPEAPDPKVQKTYRPEHPQSTPRNEECIFWFSPYLQLRITWNYQKVDGDTKAHVIVISSWYRKTHARQK